MAEWIRAMKRVSVVVSPSAELLLRTALRCCAPFHFSNSLKQYLYNERSEMKFSQLIKINFETLAELLVNNNSLPGCCVIHRVATKFCASTESTRASRATDTGNLGCVMDNLNKEIDYLEWKFKYDCLEMFSRLAFLC